MQGCKPLWNDEFENHFNANMKDEGTILASYGSYGQYEERPLKRGFHGVISTTKLERIEPYERHKIEIYFNARMKCMDGTLMAW